MTSEQLTIDPGSFRKSSDLSNIYYSLIRKCQKGIDHLFPKLPKLYESKDLIESIDVVDSTLNFHPKRVYYPGSNTDISPSKTGSLATAEIIYLDDNKRVVKALKKAQLHAVLGKAEAYNPGSIDLLLLLNFYADEPLTHVVSGGIVICNEWWKAASKLKKNNGYILVGLLRRESDTKPVYLDEDNPEDYFKEVGTREEWNRISPYSLELAKQALEKYASEFGITESDFVIAYRQLYAKCKELKGIDGQLPDNTILYQIPFKKDALLLVYRKK